MTEMRYELAIERIENIKGENTVSEKYRDYFRTLADFALLVDKLKEKIENGEYYKFSIEELECWNTHLYDDVLGEQPKDAAGNCSYYQESNPYWVDYQLAMDRFTPDYDYTNLAAFYVDLVEYLVMAVRLYFFICEQQFRPIDRGKYDELVGIQAVLQKPA